MSPRIASSVQSYGASCMAAIKMRGIHVRDSMQGGVEDQLQLIFDHTKLKYMHLRAVILFVIVVTEYSACF